MRETEQEKAAQRVVHIGGVPNPKQKLFFASRARFTAYGGARGGGKSWALRRKLVGLCLCYPGIRCLLLRRTLGEIRANHVLPMLSEYGVLLRHSAGENAFLFDNGSPSIAVTATATETHCAIRGRNTILSPLTRRHSSASFSFPRCAPPFAACGICPGACI